MPDESLPLPMEIRAEPPGSPTQREGKEYDLLYSAACCCLLHQVGLAHFWDGQPWGPGRAWALLGDTRLRQEQHIVVGVALDIWDNEGGVMLRDLRKLSPRLVVDVGELIAATGWPGALEGWLERRLGRDWQRWVDEGRWEEALGQGWRDLLGREPAS